MFEIFMDARYNELGSYKHDDSFSSDQFRRWKSERLDRYVILMSRHEKIYVSLGKHCAKCLFEEIHS